MIKEQVVQILSAKKDEQLAKVAELFDGMIQAVQALDEGSSEEVEALRARVTELEQKVADQKAVLDLANEKAKEIDAAIEDPA